MATPIRFDLSYADFRFLQAHMGRRLYARNKSLHARALLSVVFCALFLTAAIVVNLRPAATVGLLGVRYPLSAYLAIIICLIGAIISLLPAIRLRLRLPRLQVSDDGPLLGPTTLTIDDDGLAFDRSLMRARYAWAAFQGVEIAKHAIILPIDNGIGLMIPAAAFASESARLEFAAEIQKRIETAKA